MEIQTIQWKNSFPHKKIDAKKAYSELEKVRKANDGTLTDDLIVKKAANERSVLHPLFEWDDSKAAEAHRRSQARSLIRAFEVVYKEAPEARVRAFQVQKKSGRPQSNRTAYSTTEEVMNDPDSRDRLIAEAIKAAMEFRRRFMHLHELQQVVEAIDQVLVSLGTQE